MAGPAREDEAGLRASQAIVESLIAREVARGVDSSRDRGGGLLARLRDGAAHRPAPSASLAGIVGLSGYLALADRTAAERSAANQGHADLSGPWPVDPMIPLPRAQASRDALIAARLRRAMA